MEMVDSTTMSFIIYMGSLKTQEKWVPRITRNGFLRHKVMGYPKVRNESVPKEIVQIILFIVDSGMHQAYEGNCITAGTILLNNTWVPYAFGNDQFAPSRDGENLDKMKEKGDSCILVGYSTQSKGYRARFPNDKRVKIMTSLDPAPELQNVSPSADTIVPSQQELDLLFGPLYDEFFNDGLNFISRQTLQVRELVDKPFWQERDRVLSSTNQFAPVARLECQDLLRRFMLHKPDGFIDPDSFQKGLPSKEQSIWIENKSRVPAKYTLEILKKHGTEKDKASYALSWKPCQGDSLNLPDHRIHKDGDGDALFQLKSDSLPHAHAQTTKTYYKHQDSRIMKAQELKTKTSAQTLIYKIFLQRYQVYQGRLLASFQDDVNDSWFRHLATFGTGAGGVRRVKLLSGIRTRITVDHLGALDSIAEIALDSNTSFALSATAYDPPSDSVDQGIWRISCITFVMAAEDQLS
ncbi:hypothetical protein Tco_0267122 [Tanacetum coccineum]